MRALLAVIVLLLVAAGVFVLTWKDGADAPVPPGGGEPSVGGGAGLQPASAANGLPLGVDATRTLAVEPSAEDLADRPSVCLQLVDYRSQKPLAGAIARSMVNGADLAFSDERGLVSVPLKKPAQLPIVLDGYLLRLAPAQLGTTEDSPQLIQMVVDQWSLVRRFAFVDPAGRSQSDVFVRIRPAGEAPAVQSPAADGDPVLRRAWAEHTRLASHPASRDVAVQMGRYSKDRVHRLQGEVSVVRFLAPSDYVLEAATTSGLVARAEVAVIPGSQPPAQRIVMRPGAILAGVVSDQAGQPLADAEVTVQGGDPLGLRARAAADGRFEIGPLLPGSVTLLARHGLHDPVAHGPLLAPATEVAIKLRVLDRTILRGRVRRRPGLEPIANAAVIWQVPRGASITARTASDGTFELPAAGKTAAKLIVQAPGYVTYAELVDPDAAFADYDLWPADLATRLDKGVTATLQGLVLDSQGRPVPSASVRWRPANETPASAVPGRRVLEGGVLALPGVATTDASGAFVLETNQFGSGNLVLGANPDVSIATTAIAGSSTQGLELSQ